MLGTIKSLGLCGIDGYIVTAETDISGGMFQFDIVGLPDLAVKEAKDRVKAAIKNSGFSFPLGRITVNLAPAHLRKIGSVYDLPILLSILAASGQIDPPAGDTAFIGELSLSGELRAINGALPMAISAMEAGLTDVVLPTENSSEASVVEGIRVLPAGNLREVIGHLLGTKTITPAKYGESRQPNYLFDFSDVKGQGGAKRAMEIAAAGSHNVLMLGSPGAGKSMLAKRIVTILPEMSFEEQIETTKIYSVSGLLSPDKPLITERPFRSPHHTTSPTAIAGGGANPKPGELSLSHNGVLFLDELPEFPRTATEILRQPLEDKKIVISRVSGTLSYPCDIMLIAAMNPCPCGFFGHPSKPCICSPIAVNKYLSKVSGPLLDRIDIHIELLPVEFDKLSGKGHPEESSAIVLERIKKAVEIQQRRYEGTNIKRNSGLTPDILNDTCRLSDPALKMLKSAFDRLSLSARAYDRILKVARTIADLDSSDLIDLPHIAEAIQYRSLDRKYFSDRK